MFLTVLEFAHFQNFSKEHCVNSFGICTLSEFFKGPLCPPNISTIDTSAMYVQLCILQYVNFEDVTNSVLSAVSPAF